SPDSSSTHSLSNHSSLDLPSTSAGPSEDIPEPAQEGAAEDTYETLGDLFQRFHDHAQAIPVHRIKAIEGVQREQGHRTVGVESVVNALTDRVAKLERDNRRKMPNRRSGASMIHKEVEELVTRRVAKEMEAREAARNLETLNENEEEQEGENGGNGGNGNGFNGGNENGGNRGNGNKGNGENGNHGMNYGGFMQMARECTFQDFLKCKPYTFSATEGVVRLTRWFKKMETMFNIRERPNIPLSFIVPSHVSSGYILPSIIFLLNDGCCPRLSLGLLSILLLFSALLAA
nr:hypothetical protein [Tanacetum cinerariifolium]